MLHILAWETSELAGGVAAANDDKVLAEIDLEPSRRSAQSLAPAIRDLLAQVGWKPREVNLVATTVGPGSFTGLRVGVATAKAFAYAAGAEVLGISTLDAVAAAAPPDVEKLSVGVDAQRGDVVTQAFQRDASGEFEPLNEARLMPAAEWLAALPPGFAVSGPALRKLGGGVPSGIQVLPAELWSPKAAQVARLAYRDYHVGRRDDLWRLLPVYSRPSAAEEKWAKRQAE